MIGPQVYENSVLATLTLDCYDWMSIQFHQINDNADLDQTRMSLWKKIWKPKKSFSLKLLKEEKLLYTKRGVGAEPFADHFTHLEQDNNWY